ncbi:tetratricopeptide repeat protein [Flavobacterium sp. TMP13]|uniref:tetratricopeptide repeat protein n=1 Tax=Flavobacterium sp. TMP13 TaxID=3425950 RepID=UPI003D77493F
MNEEKYTQFDHYLQNEMTVEERIRFEGEVATNEVLASELESFKEMNVQLKHKFGIAEEREAFKENVKCIAESHFNSKKSKAISIKPWLYAAAASVVVVFGLFFFNQNANPNFDDFNRHEQASFTERSESSAKLKQAEQAFNTKDYKKAIPVFETILKEKSSAEIQYFYGVALLQENEFIKAEAVFTALQSGTSVYKNKATWQLALSKLKQKDYQTCKEILVTIPRDYENQKQVQHLLKELN